MLCDNWPGIEDCFEPDEEILVVREVEDVVKALRKYDDAARRRIGRAFHARALKDHTYSRRAAQAEAAFMESMSRRETRTYEAVVSA